MADYGTFRRTGHRFPTLAGFVVDDRLLLVLMFVSTIFTVVQFVA